MRNLLQSIVTGLVDEILNGAWFFIRPVFYLYLVWAGMKFAALFQ